MQLFEVGKKLRMRLSAVEKGELMTARTRRIDEMRPEETRSAEHEYRARFGRRLGRWSRARRRRLRCALAHALRRRAAGTENGRHRRACHADEDVPPRHHVVVSFRRLAIDREYPLVAARPVSPDACPLGRREAA